MQPPERALDRPRVVQCKEKQQLLIAAVPEIKALVAAVKEADAKWEAEMEKEAGERAAAGEPVVPAVADAVEAMAVMDAILDDEVMAEEGEEAADDEEAMVEEGGAVAEEGAATAAAAAVAEQPASPAEAAKAAEAARRQLIRAANKERLQAREELLGSASRVRDTVRHHFYRVAQYASLLRSTSMTTEEIIEAAWELWREGLLGHVVRRDHSHCSLGAECKQADYQPRPPLNTVARSLFVGLVMNPKIKALIAKCIYNGHTWDWCNSLPRT